MMAQMILASLLARAMAVSMRDLHASIRASHDPGFPPFRPLQWMIDIAPLISNLRISRGPIFEVRPKRCLPPLECCLGTSPSHAEKSLPRSKLSMAGAKASMTMAGTGPTPGMVRRRYVNRPGFAGG